MQPRVTAVLVARDGAQYLPRTLAALAAQTRLPDEVVLVDVASTDDTGALLREASPQGVVTLGDRMSLGRAVASTLELFEPSDSPDHFLWILRHDNAPEPTALAELLGAVEVAPSVAMAGPKLMRWDRPDTIAEYGQTLTPLGRSLPIVHDELDQAQHDTRSDLLGVEAAGMLVRRPVWEQIGGLDPALPTVDAGLDFSVRVRLAGHRVVGVPRARIASAGPAELFGHSTLSASAQYRAHRTAQLHRRLVYAAAPVVLLHWLLLVPQAVVRAVGQLFGKRLAAVGAEFAAAFAVAFSPHVLPARRRLRRTRTAGWPAVDALRMTWPQLRERRLRDRGIRPERELRDVPGFFGGGGAWVTLLAGLLGIVVFARLLQTPVVAGGGLAPLSADVAELWSHVGYGWHDAAAGFLGAADPFATVLAVLGSLTFWSPSTAIVALYLLALPLAAFTAWWAAVEIAPRPWAAAAAAIAWALFPGYLTSIGGGHLGAVLAHILLPTLLSATLRAPRSWSAAGAASLLFAVVAASGPVLIPALLVLLVVWMVVRPKALPRLLLVPLPAVVFFAPLAIEQFGRGTPWALLAEPGVPVITEAARAWQLALGMPDDSLGGWSPQLDDWGLSAVTVSIVVAVLAAPLAVLAFVALFRKGSSRAIGSLVVGLLGFASALGAGLLQVTVVGDTAGPIWAGPALSLYWAGVVGAASVALHHFGRRVTLPAVVTIVASVALAAPLVGALTVGATDAAGGNGRMIPAFAAAEAASRPEVGTLQLTPQPGEALAATLHRGQGTTMDEQSTLASTAVERSDADRELALLTGNLASRSGYDVAAAMDRLQVQFIVLDEPASAEEQASYQRATDALDGNRVLTPIGETATGHLWHYAELTVGDAPTGPGPLGTPYGIGVLVAQAVVIVLAVLLAVPSTRRRRLQAPRPETTGGDR